MNNDEIIKSPRIGNVGHDHSDNEQFVVDSHELMVQGSEE